MKTIAYSKAAQKTLTRMPANTAVLIRSKVRQLAADPASLANNVKRLTGAAPAEYRLRVGDWRVLFDDNGNVLDIVTIGPRGGVYD